MLAALALGALAGAYVILPIVRRRLALLGDARGAVIDAETRKRVALASLREIEYDRIGGKLDDEDYHRLRAQLEREALAAVQAAEGAAAGATEIDAAATVTHACGFVNPLGSRFCAGCGARL